jgi:hypothetical protein
MQMKAVGRSNSNLWRRKSDALIFRILQRQAKAIRPFARMARAMEPGFKGQVSNIEQHRTVADGGVSMCYQMLIHEVSTIICL